MSPRIGISDAFDGGNIELVRQSMDDKGNATIEVRIKPDTYVYEICRVLYFELKADSLTNLP